MNQLDIDFEKCRKVLLSCKNIDQLTGGYFYYNLFRNKYKHLVNLNSKYACYILGNLDGILEAKINNVK